MDQRRPPADSYSGQDYDRRDPPLDERAQVGHLAGGEGPDSPLPADGAGRDIGPDVGHRAYVSPNGEVHGSGAGDGGGNDGEDYDEGTAGGSGDVPKAGTAPDRD